MKFKDIQKNDNKISFIVEDIDVSILNSIRRTILSDIPNVAFDFEPYEFDNKKVDIITNTCSLHNEIILQRLSMIPLKFTENEINDFDPLKYKFKLSKTNNTNKMLNVTTGDIQIYDENDKKYSDSFIRKIFPKNKISDDFILLTKLKPNNYDKDKGDSIEINMIASKKTAKDYAGFGYVSQCVYHNIVDKDKAKQALKELKEKNKNLNSKELEDLEKDFNTLDKFRHFKTNKYDEPNSFQFDIESEARVSPEYLFFKSIEIIKGRLQRLLENIIDNKITINKIKNTQNLYEFIIENEGHTIGNLIQSILYNIHIRENEKKDINFIGYKCPHPLENTLIINIRFTNNINSTEVNAIFRKGITDIQDILDNINKKWIDKSKVDKNIKEISDYIS
jgi:DNA-directed RNA polymerase subunit L